MNIPHLRLLNQQIVSPRFSEPEKVVDWMGAVQAQDLKAAKWAVGLRTREGTLRKVEEALAKGKIIRTHVMRPTWHFVSPKDVRWMLSLNRGPMEKMYSGYLKSKGVEIGEGEYGKAMEAFARALEGGKSLGLEELTALCGATEGIRAERSYVKGYIVRAESRGLLCNGRSDGHKNTYALLDEKVPPMAEISREEAVARLAEKYFRSHCPATLQDFLWWSGLSAGEAKIAIYEIRRDLEVVKVKGRDFYVHSDCRGRGRYRTSATLIPAYDEYLLGYKDRTDVLPKEFSAKAHNTHGIFLRIIQQGGQIVGNWDVKQTAQGVKLSHSFFRSEPDFPALVKAKAQYESYL